jgi:hypothetical protein
MEASMTVLDREPATDPDGPTGTLATRMAGPTLDVLPTEPGDVLRSSTVAMRGAGSGA